MLIACSGFCHLVVGTLIKGGAAPFSPAGGAGPDLVQGRGQRYGRGRGQGGRGGGRGRVPVPGTLLVVAHLLPEGRSRRSCVKSSYSCKFILISKF